MKVKVRSEFSATRDLLDTAAIMRTRSNRGCRWSVLGFLALLVTCGVRAGDDSCSNNWMTLHGGWGDEAVHLIAPRPDGTIAVVGRGTPTTDLPEADREAIWGTIGGDDLVVIVFDPDAQEIRWRGFLGGVGDELGLDLQVEDDGTLTIAGYATLGFPVTEDALQVDHGGGERDGFVVRIDPDAVEEEDALLWATFIGGPGDDGVIGAHVDAAGAVIAAGYTSWTELPTTPDAIQPAFGGNSFDAFVLRVDPELDSNDPTKLLYGTYFGGAGSEGHREAFGLRHFGWDTALTEDGSLVLVGHTSGDDIPLTDGAYDLTENGFYDVFVCRLDREGQGFRLGYSTLLGGADWDAPTAVATTPDGGIVLSGETRSGDFPMHAAAHQPWIRGEADAFVVKLDPARVGADQLVYASYVGGPGFDGSQGVAALQGNFVAVAANATSPSLPRAGCGNSVVSGGLQDGYLAIFDLAESGPSFGDLRFARFLGGASNDWITEVTAVPGSNRVLVCGGTDSWDFPTTPGALQEDIGQPRDAFFGEIDSGLTVGFLRGDCDADGKVNISDATCTLNWLFGGAGQPGCIAALNANGDDKVDIADPLALLNFLFAGGPSPVDPFPDCGPGTLPADDELGCANPPNC